MTNYSLCALLRSALAAVLIALSLPSLAGLYPKKINFQHVLQNKDIVLGENRAIFQDSDGFMWFGGWNALVRYDGSEFLPVELTVEENGKVKTVPLVHILDIIEGKDKILWLATSTGVARYDREQHRMTKIADSKDQATAINASFITSVVELPSGDILASSESGIFIIDHKTLRYLSLTSDPSKPNDPGRPIDANVRHAYVSSSGEVWLATAYGLDKFDWKKTEFKHYRPDPHSDDASKNSLRKVIEADNGKLWLASADGVILFDPENSQSKRFTHDPENPNSLTTNNIWNLTKDSKGRLWVALDQGGLALYEPTKGHFISYMHSTSQATSLASNIVRTIYEDRTGDIWIGLYPEGIDFFDQSSTAITSYTKDANDPASLNHNSVLTVAEDARGNLWVGTDGGGINYLDRQTDKFTSYTRLADDPNSPASNAILTSLIDSTNTLWMGHWEGGVTTYDLKTRTFTRLPYSFPEQRLRSSKILNSGHIWSIYEDRDNQIWIGTHNGGLNHYDRDSKVFTHYWPNPSDPKSISAEWVWSIREDSRGNFWVGTINGLNLMNRKDGTFRHFVPDPDDPKSLSEAYALTIFEDSKGRLWVGTNVGLNRYDYEFQNFTRITTADGLNNDSVRSIVEDTNGLLWLGTANGVSSLNPDTMRIKNYTRDGGQLVGGFNYDAALVTKQGEVVMGGINGLRIYKPDELNDNPTVPPVVLTQLKIYSDNITIGDDDGILDKALNYTDKIVLDYKKSMFTIEYAALNYRDSEKNQYMYKLDGFDEDWIRAGSERTAKYTNLDAGTYTFRVKGSNNDGVWNEEGKSLTIVQLPPPWLTWWAFTIYICTVLGLVAWAIEHQRRKRRLVEQQNKILEEKVAERTAELRQKNYDIQAMLGNMRQGLFTVQNDSTIHPEYAQFLETIFETKDIAGRNAIAFLFSCANVGSNLVNQVQEGIKAIIGEDPMNFEFNTHVFINEYDIDINGRKKHLSLDWNPIVVEDIVTKLMVSVRDITLLRQMESESQAQKRELAIISQLLTISSKKFNAFEKSVDKFIQENRVKIKACHTPDEKVLALLFRNMHTIKGNCRTYGFTYLSNIAHDVETTYSSLKDTKTSWDQEHLLHEQDLVERGLEEYSDIYRRVLGRGETVVQGGPSGIWLDENALKRITESVATIQMCFAGQNLDGLKPIQSIMENASSSPIPEVLSDIVESLLSIAEQLDKPCPSVQFDTQNIRVKESAYDLMNNVFAHIMRNCLDHGIEMPEHRISIGKSMTGTIRIFTRVDGDKVHIHVADDGRGLNIQNLFQIGVKLGKWSETATPKLIDIAQLIFASGVSTAERVTDISGRGVGMDAAKEYLRESNGDISVKLQDENQGCEKFAPFEMIVTLPKDMMVLSDGN